MEMYELFKKFELVKDKKEFIELYHLRSLYINNSMITDISHNLNNVKVIRVGLKEINL